MRGGTAGGRGEARDRGRALDGSIDTLVPMACSRATQGIGDLAIMTPAADRAHAMSLVPVSRETGTRLATFVDLLRRWQAIKNLVAASTLDMVWTRHVADSLQLLAHAPEARRWVDLGSGAGFPGLVIAIALAEVPGARVDLIEANARKCAFLREAARACGAPARVHNDRVATVMPALEGAEIVTARALAPLPVLIEMSDTALGRGACGLFLKSEDEIDRLDALGPPFTMTVLPSLTSEHGRIVRVRKTAPAPAPGGPGP